MTFYTARHDEGCAQLLVPLNHYFYGCSCIEVDENVNCFNAAGVLSLGRERLSQRVFARWHTQSFSVMHERRWR